jgi:hypothetical protein
MAQVWLDHGIRTQVTPDQMAAEHLASIMYGAKNIRGPFFYPQSPYGQPLGMGRLGQQPSGGWNMTISFSASSYTVGGTWTVTLTGGPPNYNVLTQINGVYEGGATDSNGNFSNSGAFSQAGNGQIRIQMTGNQQVVATFNYTIGPGGGLNSPATVLLNYNPQLSAGATYVAPTSAPPGYTLTQPSTQSAPLAQPGAQPGVTPLTTGTTSAAQTVPASQQPPPPAGNTGNTIPASTSWETWALVGGAALLLFFTMGGKH